MESTDLVTGATGYSGAYVSERLMNDGRSVRTLTRDPGAVSGPIEAFAYRFDDPDQMREAFDGVDTFYNTYWVRFGRGSFTHDDAVANSIALVDAAARAGVRRIVHVSIMNPSVDSQYTYHRGKALVEQAVQASGMQYAIVRPSALFGGSDILLNNVAWLLRRLHVFAVPGDGNYPIRPTHVEDLADLMVALGASSDPVIRNAGGPETFAFGDLVRMIRDAIGVRALVMNVPKSVSLPMIRIVNCITRDVTLHREELDALMDGLASCDGEAAGHRHLSDFLADGTDDFGRHYASEISRNFETVSRQRHSRSVPLTSRA
ncbi:MAG: NAD(P)H-binding protein [Actinomycetia bacterium]|nr:NAD(P)H-binding protein [Actinomycetes bacterium]MCP4959251.1 NAD(P)H-binding protein [Actinomycetes bacterium]